MNWGNNALETLNFPPDAVNFEAEALYLGTKPQIGSWSLVMHSVVPTQNIVLLILGHAKPQIFTACCVGSLAKRQVRL